jgi:hypothetical protein
MFFKYFEFHFDDLPSKFTWILLITFHLHDQSFFIPTAYQHFSIILYLILKVRIDSMFLFIITEYMNLLYSLV